MTTLTNQSLEGLLDPRSIALIGASANSRVGRAIVENLQHLGYEGAIYPINPRYQEVGGLRCYPSLADVPGPIDAAMIATSTDGVIPILEECGRHGVRGAVVTADGFLGRVPGGGTLQDKLAATARKYGIAVCGPNCMGVFNGASGGSLYTGVLNRAVPRGNVSGVFQTGTLTISFLNNDRGLNCRYLISSGNEAITTAGDYVAYLAEDPGTRVIAVALEGMRDPDTFLAGVERATSLGKRVVLLHLGVSPAGKALTAGHTGALAGSRGVWRSICRQFGIAQVSDAEEMFATCLLMSQVARPKGRRVGAITLSGGAATLAADLGEASGLQFPEWSPETRSVLAKSVDRPRPRNPFDAWGTGNYRDGLATSISAVLNDRATDFVIVMQDLPPAAAPNGVDVPDACVEIVSELAVGAPKPIAIVGTLADTPGPRYGNRLAKVHSAYLGGAEVAMRALGHWAAPDVKRSGLRIGQARRNARNALRLGGDPSTFRDHGIPFVDQVLCHSEIEAESAASRFGYPVVLKVESPDLPHKTEAGGVRLNVQRGSLGPSYRRLIRDVNEHSPDARIDGVLVQRQATQGLEMIVGAVREPDWGWTLMVGLGGIYAEIWRDVVFRRPPIKRSEAVSMLHELRSYPLLAGIRRQPPYDEAALADAIVAVGRLVLESTDDLTQLEFNPVIVYPSGQGVVAVDALILTHK